MYTAEDIADLTSRLGAATGPKSANQAARRGAEQATRWADWSRERRRAGKSLPACQAELLELRRVLQRHPDLNRTTRVALGRAVDELVGPPPAATAGR